MYSTQDWSLFHVARLRRRSVMMRRCRFLSSTLTISIGMFIAGPFSNLDRAFGQSIEEAAQLNQEAIQLTIKAAMPTPRLF
jgi:hypothetical protein